MVKDQDREKGSYRQQEMEREVRLPLWCRVHSHCRGRAEGTDRLQLPAEIKFKLHLLSVEYGMAYNYAT